MNPDNKSIDYSRLKTLFYVDYEAEPGTTDNAKTWSGAPCQSLSNRLNGSESYFSLKIERASNSHCS